MTTIAQQILEQFDRLADEEKKKVAAEIIQRTVSNNRPPLSDEELIFNADSIFLALEEREQPNEGAETR